MSDHEQELAEFHATICRLQAEKDVQQRKIEENTAEIKANLARIAKQQRMLELGGRLLASNRGAAPELMWARIEAEGEKSARQQAERLEGLSDEEVLQEAQRQERQAEAARKRKRRRLQKALRR